MAEIWSDPAPNGSTASIAASGDQAISGAARDGLVGLYALRILDRGVDPRALVAEHRAHRYGVGDRPHRRPAAAESLPSVTAVGRGALTSQPLDQPLSDPAPSVRPAPVARPPRVRRLALPTLPGVAQVAFGLSGAAGRSPRRLAAAGFAIAAMLGVGVLSAFAQELPAQQRYVVQQGDSLETVSAAFGVSPDAILAASAVEQPPLLTPSEVIVIPDPAQSPEAAAIMAAERDGTSPFVTAAYFLAEGDTLADVAAWYQVPVETLATFNGISSPEQLTVGQRLLIPAVEAEGPAEIITAPAGISDAVTSGADLAAYTGSPDQVIEVTQPADLGPEAAPSLIATEVIVPGVPGYHQAANLSSGYAAAYIATSAFGAGVPEAVFIESVPLSPNPHWGYRGNLNGDWGGTTDYGVYAEPLVPVLNANGFSAEVFYGAGDPTGLRAYLDAGRPVIAWLGLSGDTAYAVDDGSYLLAPGMHAVVVYGYDEAGVYLADPASGGYDYYAWADFLALWSTLNGMGLAVSPW